MTTVGPRFTPHARRAVVVVLALALGFVTVQRDVYASGKAKRKGRLNMPKGWDWPPSAKMRAAGKRCLNRLDELGVSWKKAPELRKIATPIRLPTLKIRGVALASIWRKPPFAMDCQLALAIAEIAPELRKLGVKALRFSTIHQYRFVRKNKRTTKILSRHALGLAMDVFEIETDDGVVHVVKKRYKHGDKTLHAVERVARRAGVFRALLTPGNDPRSHHDHFHFEAAMPLP